jgi:hypothetical protein
LSLEPDIKFGTNRMPPLWLRDRTFRHAKMWRAEAVPARLTPCGESFSVALE